MKTSPVFSLNFLSKVNFQQRIRAERFDGAQFLRQRINQRRHAVRRDDGIGMAVKGDDERDRIVLPRVGDGLPDDLLVAEMHAVKHADGQADLAAAVASSLAAWMIFMGRRIRAASFKNGNHFLFQFCRRQIHHVIELGRVGHVEFSGNAPAQRGQVRAAAELLAEVVREAADVGALGAGDAKFAERLGIFVKRKL